LEKNTHIIVFLYFVAIDNIYAASMDIMVFDRSVPLHLFMMLIKRGKQIGMENNSNKDYPAYMYWYSGG
jgi:hypothetical protein